MWVVGRSYLDGEIATKILRKRKSGFVVALKRGMRMLSVNWDCSISLAFQWSKPDEAVKWFRKAAEQGHSMGQNNLGLEVMFWAKSVVRITRNPVRWFRKAASKAIARPVTTLACVMQKVRQ